MKYAPIIIPTLSRATHFIRLMDSLKKNTWAKYTDVYIGLDYPPSKEYEDGYNRICEYLSTPCTEFASLTIIKRPYNFGAARNAKELRQYILTRYDRFIRTDDDIEFSPNFLEYMNKCLDYYENDPNVIAVSGYSYPINWVANKGDNIVMENFSCPMWGTGFWRNKFQIIDGYISSGGVASSKFRTLLTRFHRMTHRCQWEYINFCLSKGFPNTLASKISDISVRMYMAIHNKYVIIPTLSKVRNWGFDGTGLYCPDNSTATNRSTALDYPYEKQIIDQLNHFEISVDTTENPRNNILNKKLMNDFDPIPFKASVYIFVKRMLFLLFRIE